MYGEKHKRSSHCRTAAFASHKVFKGMDGSKN